VAQGFSRNAPGVRQEILPAIGRAGATRSPSVDEIWLQYSKDHSLAERFVHERAGFSRGLTRQLGEGPAKRVLSLSSIHGATGSAQPME